MAGTHAKKGPSGAKRYHACSGCIPLAEKLPEAQRKAAGHAASLGTAAHGLLERSLTDRIHPSEFKGRLIELVGENEDVSFLRVGAKRPKDKTRKVFPVDQKMVDDVGLAYDYVLGLIAEHPHAQVTLESKTNPIPDRDDTKGTADVTIDTWPYELHVVDYKNGRMLVEHEDNEQLLAYLAGRAHDFGWDYERYKITIIQPNAYHDEGRIRSATVTSDDLRAFIDKHRAACERVDEADDALNALDGSGTDQWADTYLVAGDHCTMCQVMATCPAYRKMLEEEARILFADDPTEDIRVTISNVDRALQVLKWAPYMQALIKACNAYAYNALVGGETVPGKKLVRGKSTRKFRDDMTPDRIANEMVKGGYISDNEKALLWSEPAFVSAPTAEKLVPANLRKKFGEAFVVKPPGRLTMVDESDGREAVVLDPAAEFEPLDEESL